MNQPSSVEQFEGGDENSKKRLAGGGGVPMGYPKNRRDPEKVSH